LSPPEDQWSTFSISCSLVIPQPNLTVTATKRKINAILDPIRIKKKKMSERESVSEQRNADIIGNQMQWMSTVSPH
jgi:hypothetical protein